MAEEQFDMSN